MKAIFYTALIISAPLALADINLGSPAAPEVKAERAAENDAQQYLDMAHEVMQAVKELTALLQNVQDQASADAAAAQINSVTTRMIELQQKAEAMPTPSAAVELQVRNSMNLAEVQKTAGDFINSFIRIGMNNAYGSQALINALGPVVNAMPGIQE